MRSRNIKPGFFDNEELAVIGPCGQILFEGLWCLADRKGRLEDRPIRIKAKIFPYYEPFIGLTVNPPLQNGEPTVTERLIQILTDKGFLSRYEVGKKRYIQINNFLKHQSPHKTEKQSEIPDISTGSIFNGEPTVNPPLDNGESRPDSLIPDSTIKSTSNGDEEEKTSEPKIEYSKFFTENFWDHYPKKVGKKKAYAEFKKIKEIKTLSLSFPGIIKKQIAYKEKQKKIEGFAPKFPDPERWLKYARWEDELPEINEQPLREPEQDPYTCEQCGAKNKPMAKPGLCIDCAQKPGNGDGRPHERSIQNLASGIGKDINGLDESDRVNFLKQQAADLKAEQEVDIPE